MKTMHFTGLRSIAGMGVIIVVGGCVATTGQLERGLAEQRAALEAERVERMAADEAMAGDVQRVAGDMDGLRTELAALDNEFGAKITQLEEGMQLAVPVHFAFDEAEVEAETEPLLDRFAALVQRHYPDAAVTVEGFADPAGGAEYNRALSQKRAEAVKAQLVERGLLETQLRAVGYGEERLVVPGAAGEAYGAELNRRVVFVIETPPTTALGVPAQE
ncbi:MAG: OmpA family protein [Gemmatimonadota bacterium]